MPLVSFPSEASSNAQPFTFPNLTTSPSTIASQSVSLTEFLVLTSIPPYFVEITNSITSPRLLTGDMTGFLPPLGLVQTLPHANLGSTRQAFELVATRWVCDIVNITTETAFDRIHLCHDFASPQTGFSHDAIFINKSQWYYRPYGDFLIL